MRLKNIQKTIILENTVFSSNNSSACSVIEAPIEVLNFSVPLFHRPEFVYRNGRSSLLSFSLVHPQRNTTEAMVYFSMPEHPKALSIPAAPFGSFYGRSSCSEKDAYQFVGEVKLLLKSKGFQRIEVKHYPASYNQKVHDLFLTAMRAHGFKLIYQEFNQYINVGAIPFEETLHASERRRLKKCHQAGFVVECSAHCHAEEWFDRIVRARKQKGHPLTIDLEGLRNLNKPSPAHYHFFEVKDQGKTIASAVAIEVLPDVLYYYLPADEVAYHQYSPMVMLLEGMYRFAQQKKMRILDLGISSSEGILNEGLSLFKSHLGAQEEYKFVLTCSL